MGGDVQAAFRAEQRAATRSTTLVAGVVAIVGLPLWAVFDRIVLPEAANAFLVVRLVFGAAVVVTWLALRSSRLGTRWPEPLAFLMVAWVDVAIAWMIPRAGDGLEPYLLGQTLAIYATAFVIVWRWQLTALLVGLTVGATTLFSAVAPDRPSASEVATIGFYLCTAGALAIAAQLYRSHNDWVRFVAQSELAAERDRNLGLVAELEALSRQDALTGVGNRRAFEERVTEELLRAQRTGAAVSLIVGDLDHFKTVNDTLGHAAGDRVLQTALSVITNGTRSADFVARLGGDEFCVVCPDTGLLDAEVLATRLVDAARRTSWPHGLAVTFSLGVAEARPGEMDPAELLHRADRALYAAKSTRNTVRVA